jgi:hypothetical protein
MDTILRDALARRLFRRNLCLKPRGGECERFLFTREWKDRLRGYSLQSEAMAGILRLSGWDITEKRHSMRRFALAGRSCCSFAQAALWGWQNLFVTAMPGRAAIACLRRWRYASSDAAVARFKRGRACRRKESNPAMRSPEAGEYHAQPAEVNERSERAGFRERPGSLSERRARPRIFQLRA